MLESLTLTFQCHTERAFVFEPVTVLCGDNGSGKSAVVRALQWLGLNEWDGKADEQVPWGAAVAQVTAQVDGRTVARTKGKGVNRYSLDGEEFNAVKAGVPEPVADLLNLGRDNFQLQWDQPYWLMLTAGQAAQALNEIFSLSAIDQALAAASSEVKHAKITADFSRERLTAAKQKWRELEWTEDADRRLKEIEATRSRLGEIDREIRALREILTLSQEIGAMKSTLAELKRLGTSLGTLESRMAEVDRELADLRAMLELEDELCRLREKLVEQEGRLEELRRGQCPLCLRGPAP